MPGIAETTAGVGGLEVLNGRQKGTRVPLRLPVTVIGSGPGCDVRLTAAGVGELHCVVVVTPAGPAVRSLFPESTRLNGGPAAAALLRDGDELAVGPCTFRLAWHGATAADRPAAPPAADPSAAPASPHAEWQLKEREQALHEQEHQLATLIEERQRQVQGLLDQLAEGREQLRRERAATAAERAEATAAAAEARRLHTARKRDRERARKAAARLLRRTRAKCTAELAAATAERQGVERDRRVVAADLDRLAAERDRFRADAEAHTARVHDAWAMLAEGQDRLAAERKDAEQELSRLFQLLDTRSAAVAAEEQKLEEADRRLAAERRAFEDHGEAVREEVAGLEQRAANLRAVVEELEARRASLAAPPADAAFVPDAIPVMDPVPLDGRADRSADELLTLLQYREHELDRERKALVAAREELDRLAGDLADQRAVLAEQADRLADDRREWQQSEAVTVAEFEAVARDLDERERAVAGREDMAARAETARRERERDLARFRAKLDGWQAALTAHEARFFAEKHSVEADLAARRGRVVDREAGLAKVCRVWGEVRARERAELAAELTRCAEERGWYAAGLAGLDRERQGLLADAGRVAGLAVALEEARQSWEKTAGSPRAARRLRVFRRRWEGQFRRYAAALARRRDALAAEAAALDDRSRELRGLIAAAAAERAVLAERRQELDRAQLAAEPAAGDEPVILSLADARRGDNHLAGVRAEVERLAAEVRLQEDGADADGVSWAA